MKHHGKGTKNEPFYVKENAGKVTAIYFLNRDRRLNLPLKQSPQFPESSFRGGKKKPELPEYK